ncbi:MAG TPA: calcium-binding protein [Solirubrobacterales bacterium]|nr:calcium-binding protein [Solirubrobacterales bacterium]
MRRTVLLLAVPALCLLGPSSSAAPTRDGIFIRSANSGSHLRLTVRGEQLFVNGRMQPSPPQGCRLMAGLRVAVCRLTGTGSVTIEMGPSNDKIEVIDRLPVPLVAYLGSGSDKLIGNGERDLCYPQGARRNRCIGNGGNDVCISGPKNTDCVGGPGDDYCETSNGSDGCWGGPGRDVCVMGGGQDGCHGDAGNDRLLGGPAPDQLYGGSGHDYCNGGSGVGRSHACESGPRR